MLRSVMIMVMNSSVTGEMIIITLFLGGFMFLMQSMTASVTNPSAPAMGEMDMSGMDMSMPGMDHGDTPAPAPVQDESAPHGH